MNVLIVFDSVFGNTEKAARAMGEALAPLAAVTVVKVGEVKPEHWQNAGLILVGSPTRGFNPTPEMKKWLGALPAHSLAGKKAAAFDTRANLDEVGSKFLTFMVGVFGYAAEPMAKKLEQKGARLAVPAAGFFVKDREGPLHDGELERAAEWAKQALA